MSQFVTRSLCALWLCAPLAACAGRLPAEASRTTPTHVDLVLLPESTPPPQAAPRVIVRAPAPEPPPAGAEGAPPPAPFAPRDSPLLAYYDSVPHGEKPVTAAEAQPTRKLGWTVRYRPYWGYGPYYSSWYGPSYYYGHPGYGWGRPRVGLGFGLGFGLGVWGGRSLYGRY